jgi:hypothetical protein
MALLHSHIIEPIYMSVPAVGRHHALGANIGTVLLIWVLTLIAFTSACLVAVAT